MNGYCTPLIARAIALAAVSRRTERAAFDWLIEHSSVPPHPSDKSMWLY